MPSAGLWRVLWTVVYQELGHFTGPSGAGLPAPSGTLMAGVVFIGDLGYRPRQSREEPPRRRFEDLGLPAFGLAQYGRSRKREGASRLWSGRAPRTRHLSASRDPRKRSRQIPLRLGAWRCEQGQDLVQEMQRI